MNHPRSVILACLFLVSMTIPGLSNAQGRLATPACTAPSGRVIILLRAAATLGQPEVLHQLALGNARDVVAFHIINGVAAIISRATACRLANDANVLAVTPDRQVLLTPTPNLPARRTVRVALGKPLGVMTEPESLQLTGASNVQASGDSGQGVLVADIDTGLDTTQPNMQNVLAHNAAGQPLYYDFTNTDWQDSMGHGTGTAGMMVSQGVTTYSAQTTPYYGSLGGDPTVTTNFRVLGMAPSAKLIVAKVFDARLPGQGGYASWIVHAIQWVVDNHAQVINESFGWQELPTNTPDPVTMADQAAARKGVIVCVAAGNSGPGFGTVADPAASGLVVAVGASTMFRDLGQDGYLALYNQYESDQLASFSSRGLTSDGRMRPDLLSPGENGWDIFAVSGPAAGAGIGLFGGTSQATPIVAGAFALALSAYQRKYGHQPPVGYLKSLFMSTADDLGYSAEDESAGRVDVARAVAAIDGSGPNLLIAPSSLAFSGGVGQTVTRQLTITNHGSSAATVSASMFTQTQQSSQTFSGVTPASQNGAGSGFTINVPAGVNLLTATAIWRTSDNQPLITQLVDPQGRLANYGGGGGIAPISVANPAAGAWRVYVANGNTSTEAFRLQVTMARNVDFGSVSPSQATIAPGQSAKVSVSLAIPSAAGRTVETIKLQVPGGVETVPAIVTVPVPVNGHFAGAFVAPASSGVGAEVYTYNLTVPSGAKHLTVAVSWPDAGNGIQLFLVGPRHKIVAHSGFSLAHTGTQLRWSHLSSGPWQLIVTCPVFSGQTFSEPYTGAVTEG